MSYVIVQFSEPREVFIDDQSQGDNLAASGRPRALFVGAGCTPSGWAARPTWSRPRRRTTCPIGPSSTRSESSS